MKWPALDVRAWNLTMGATVVMTVGCGAAVDPSEETGGGTDTDAVASATDASGDETSGQPPATETSSEPSTSTTSTSTSTTEPVECYVDEDCVGPYEYLGDCIDNECRFPKDHEDYCLRDEDCEIGALCDGPEGYSGYCFVFDQVPECEASLQLIPRAIGSHGEDPVISLTFVASDETGVEDLVIGTASGAHIASTATASDPVQVTGPGDPVAAVGAVGADFFSDGGVDLALVGPDGEGGTLVNLWQSDGAGSYTLAGVTAGIAELPQYVRAARTAEGTTDALILTESGNGLRQAVRVSTEASPFDAIGTPQDVGELEVADVDGNGVDDLVFTRGGVAVFDVAGEERPTGAPWAFDRRLASGSGTDSDRDDVFAITPLEEWTLIERYRNVMANYAQYALLDGPVFSTSFLVAAGGVDGDGNADLVLLDGDTLTVIFEGDDGPRCWSSATLAEPKSVMSVGVFDDGGRASIAVSNGASVELLSLDDG